MAQRGRPKKDPVKDRIRKASQETGIAPGVATALAAAIALNTADAPKRYSEQQMADKFDQPISLLKAFKNKIMPILPEMRENMIIHNLAIANLATVIVAERMQDPVEVAKMKTADVSRVAVAHHGIARDLSPQVPKLDGNTLTVTEIERVRIISQRMEQTPSLRDRMEGAVIEAETTPAS